MPTRVKIVNNKKVVEKVTATSTLKPTIKPAGNNNLKVDINIQNNHVIVDVTGSSSPKKKINIFDAIKAKDFDSISLYDLYPIKWTPVYAINASCSTLSGV